MSSKRTLNILILLVLVASILPATAAAAPPGPGNAETAPAPVPASEPAISTAAPSSSAPSAPPQTTAPVDLVLDDGTNENTIGIGAGGIGIQFIWMNRFTPGPLDFPFDLEEIWVSFANTDVPVGGAIDLIVYEDTDGDGDPSDAVVVAVYNDVVQFNDGTWSEYTLSPPVTLNGPGDVVIGVVNRYMNSGVDPQDHPAALDMTASQYRSWVGWYTTDPPDPPVLPPDDTWGIIDDFGFPGNWMIRGYGNSGAQLGLSLTPASVEVVGCAAVSQTHTFELYNMTGVDDTFDLTYDVPTANGAFTGPADLYVANGDTVPFDVELTPDECQFEGTEVVATIDAAGSTTYTAEAVISKTITLGMNEWLSAADTPQGTRYHAVAEYDGYIYQIGGEIDWWTPTTAVQRLDVASDAWAPAAPLPVAINTMDAAEIDGLIYVPGGSDDLSDWRLGGTFLDTLHIYDPGTDSWSTGASMPAPLAGASAVAYDGLLYVAGGLQNDGDATDSLYIYDPVADSWSVGASMAMTRSLAAAAAIDGQIYIAGGYVGENGIMTGTIDTMEIYDIDSDTWSVGSGLPGGWAPYGDGVFADRYFVVFNGGDVGGGSFFCGQDAVWYDTLTGQWAVLPSLPRCLYGSQGVGVDDRFYLVSGRTNENGWHMAIEVEYLTECPACPESGLLEGWVLDGELGGGDPTCKEAFLHLDPGNQYVPVGPDGYYVAEVFSGTYTAEASAPGYSVETAMVDVTTGMTTSQDFDLARPVIEVEPTDFISVSVGVGEPATLPLTIDNLGHLDLDFEIIEVPPSVWYLDQVAPTFLTTRLEGDVEVDPQVLAELDANGTTDFFVQMRLQADLSPAYGIDDWSERGHYVYGSLQAAAEAQKPIMTYAEGRGLEYATRLASNSVFIKGGTMEDVNALAARADVKQIRANHIHELQDDKVPASPDAWGWNLDELDPDNDLYGMQAVQVWQNYGIKGKGIVVANIDTGAYYEHEALVNQYRGNLGGGVFDHDFNWYLPTSGCGDGSYPCDNDGHGSGTIGIIAGGTADQVEQIGIAPESMWIACKGCEANSCSDEALTGCADWMVAPCPIGVDPGDPACDPDMRPHVINNSWGSDGCNTWYQPYIVAWRAAGQFPAFSAGNTTACAAVGSPGDLPEAFGTAAHADDGVNLYAGGPSCHFPNPTCAPDDHQVDPHLNAPSFGRTSGNWQGQYYDLSGTSGASPHTAGCVALVWAANPFLAGDIDTTFTILEQSADRTSTQPWAEGVCGKPACAGADTYPNYEYGWGYLDCNAAVEWALSIRPDLDWVGVDPDMGVVPPEGSEIVDVVFTCDDFGDLTGTLVIQHNDPCADVLDIPIEIHCVDCVPVVDVALTVVTTGTIAAGAPVDFQADIMPDHAGKPYTYTVDYGDGTAPTMGTSSDDPLALSYTYADVGTYTVEIGVLNCDMTEPVTDTVEVVVAGPAMNYIYLPVILKNY